MHKAMCTSIKWTHTFPYLDDRMVVTITQCMCRAYMYDYEAKRIYIIIRCHMKQRFVRRVNTTFTSFCAKTFHTTTIYISFSAEVESAQLVLKLDIAHFVHMIWMSDRPVASMRSAPMVLLSPAQLYEPCNYTELTFTLREKGLVRDDSCSKRWFNHCFTIGLQHFCTHYFCIQRSHNSFVV